MCAVIRTVEQLDYRPWMTLQNCNFFRLFLLLFYLEFAGLQSNKLISRFDFLILTTANWTIRFVPQLVLRLHRDHVSTYFTCSKIDIITFLSLRYTLHCFAIGEAKVVLKLPGKRFMFPHA